MKFKVAMKKILNALHNPKIKLIAALVAIVLLAVTLGFTIAYLTDAYEETNDPVIGSVGIEVYTNEGNQRISGFLNQDDEYVLGQAYSFALALGENDVDLWIKNTGTINGLVKIFISVTLPATELENEIILTTGQVTLTSANWVNSYIAGSSVHAFESFYNNKLAPNTLTRVLNSITVPAGSESLVGKTVNINLRAEIVAHSGNAYLLESEGATINPTDYPFGPLSSAFLNDWTAWQ